MRIFGLGLSRTGTTSLTRALIILGIRAKHYPSLRYIVNWPIGIKRRELRKYDALTDIPVIPFYKRLDRRFPGSKFVLTERAMDEWLDSCERFRRFRPDFTANRKTRTVRRAVYGIEEFQREHFREAYRRHQSDVLAYFASRPNDLLRLDITAGQGWERLCPFVGLPVPDEYFPRLNAGHLPDGSLHHNCQG